MVEIEPMGRARSERGEPLEAVADGLGQSSVAEDELSGVLVVDSDQICEGEGAALEVHGVHAVFSGLPLRSEASVGRGSQKQHDDQGESHAILFGFD